MVKSAINCKFCGNLLAKPTGGKAILFGKQPVIMDDLPDIAIQTNQMISGTKKRFLLDTMIIHALINHVPLHQLVDDDIIDNIEFVLLDRILIETKNMEYDKYSRTLSTDDIINILNSFGTCDVEQVDYASDYVLDAMELFESKKYQNTQGVCLSETDCILLQKALTTRDVKLITRDETLLNALKNEKQKLYST